MFPKKNQNGFAIISAIFLIVVLAFLGVSMSRIFSSGQQAINQDITSLQAYFAGQSALQWGMYQAIYPKPPTSTYTISFSNEGLKNTKASVEFNKNTILSKIYYKMTAHADYASAGNPEYSLRNLEVRFTPP